MERVRIFLIFGDGLVRWSQTPGQTGDIAVLLAHGYFVKDLCFLPSISFIGGSLSRTILASSRSHAYSSSSAEDLYLYGDPMHLSEKGHRLVSKIVGGELTRMLRQACIPECDVTVSFKPKAQYLKL